MPFDHNWGLSIFVFNLLGYVEDGREIFDDDEGEASYSNKTKKNRNKNEIEKPKKEEKKSANIKNMILSMTTNKKKDENVTIDDDELLGDILGKIKPKQKVIHFLA